MSNYTDTYSLRLLCFTIAFISLMLTQRAYAFEINLVDQFGQPVANAFVAIPDDEIQSVPASPAVMDQIDIQFSPHVLAVEQGRDVIFPNSDNIRHHVYSFSEPKRFEIKLYQGVPKSPIRFDDAGLVALGCNIHDSMLAYIYVSPWPLFSLTAADGRAVIKDSRPEEGSIKRVAVWHPWMKGVKEAQMYDVVQDAQGKASIELKLSQPKPVKKFKNYRRRYND